jgi:hypothetical protein
MTMSSKQVVVTALVAGVVALTGCPDTGIVCRMGTNRCGTGCADYTSDRRNCGGCGQACAAAQVCVATGGDPVGRCECQAGTSLCEGRCVATATDPMACGSCGTACANNQVCEQGQCKASCMLGISTRCGASCVDTSSDIGNCGGCERSCQAGQKCVKGGCTSDVVVACFSSGQVTGVSASSLQRSPLADFGTGPAALAMMNGVLLGADGIDRKLNQADLPSGSATYRELMGRSIPTGAVPNQVLVDGDFVYVVNAQSGTLQVVRRGAGDGDAGIALSTVQELVFGANTYPQGAAKAGSSLWVPLYGGYGLGTLDAGQRVIEVNVDDPANPRVASEVSLQNLDLKAFDGGAPVARPFAIVERRGQLYVALNNFNAECNPICVPGGPGLLARIDPSTKGVTVIDLGADACLNPQWVATLGDALVVSCGGRANYTGQNFVLTSVLQAGVVVLDAMDRRVATWAPVAGACGDGGVCPLFLPGRFAVKGSTVFLGDQNAGRLVVLDYADGGLIERRGPAKNDGLEVCPVSSSGIANVADVLAP